MRNARIEMHEAMEKDKHPDRDPRTDPQPGDVLIAGPQWQSERYEVVSRDSDVVRYRIGERPMLLPADIRSWREWMRGAEVVTNAR